MEGTKPKALTIDQIELEMQSAILQTGSTSSKRINPQDLADALQRDAQLRKTRAELLRAIFNRAGLERLRAVTDADWREAEVRDSERG